MQNSLSITRSHLWRILTCLAVILLALTTLPTPTAHADSIAVTTTTDSLDAAGGVCGNMTPKNIVYTGDGLVSLREAICAANNTPAANTIFLPFGKYTLTLAGHSDDDNLTGDLDIKVEGGDLTILGSGPTRPTISGLGPAVDADRVLHIDPTRTGGITVSITNVIIRNGYSMASGMGGGLNVMGDNTLNLTNCAIRNNWVVAAGGSSGGGIWNDGAIINITDCAISLNRASAAVNSARGGGIHNTSGGTVNITSSTIYSNTAIVVYDWDYEAHGGGIYSWFSPINIADSTISENRAITSGSGGTCGRGGGIYSYEARISLTNQTFLTDNYADIDGGGFFNYKGTLTVEASTISDNETRLVGGGIFDTEGEVSIQSSTVASNRAVDYGGGIYLSSSTAAFTDTFFVGNVTGASGGGICASGSTVSFSGGTIIGNEAEYDGGGIDLGGSSATLISAIIGSNLAQGDGGGIHLASSSTDIANTVVLSNSAHTDGGGIFVSGGALNLDQVAITGNTSDSDGDGSGNGGGIHSAMYSSSAVTITNSIVNANATGILGVGGGISSADGSMFIANSTLSGNRADFGGGINIDNSIVDLSHVTITDNTADDDDDGTGYGGGIYCDATGTVHLKGSIVAGNHAKSSATKRDCNNTTYINSHSYNLVGSGTGCPSNGTGDRITSDPGLGPLADNGGSTQTHALLPTSPAIDGVVDCTDLDGSPVTADQRGQPRPLDGDLDGTARCDIGAYEFEAATTHLPLVLRGY